MEFTKIPFLTNYEISKNGMIRNIKTKKIKSQYVGSTGYYMVSFSINNKSKPYRVHRLLAKVFILNKNNYEVVNHKDGNKLNNDLSNLEWCTQKFNMKHANLTGLINNKGVKNGMSKLDINKVKQIKKMLIDGITQNEIAKQFNVSRSCILKINLGRTWTDV